MQSSVKPLTVKNTHILIYKIPTEEKNLVPILYILYITV